MRQTWVRHTLQRHANVDVRFVLAQPDVPLGSHPGGLGSPAGLADAVIEAAFSILQARTVPLNPLGRFLGFYRQFHEAKLPMPHCKLTKVLLLG